MEILGERPAWSMSDSEKLSTLDAVDAEVSRLLTYRLHVLADYDAGGHAATLGAGDTARLLAFRHRLDPGAIRRDLQLAKDLHKYPAVTNALPPVHPDPGPDTEADATEAADAADSAADLDGADAPDGAGGEEAVVLSPAQAAVIVAELEAVPDTVPVEDLAVAEQQLVGLGRHLCPSELRKAARRVRDLLDADGPAPEEDKAYAREELRLRTADRGVKFSGYLANDNAELFQALILAGAKPRKTVTGELDPRTPGKRRADALTDVLNVASNAITAATPANGADPADPPATADTATGNAGEAALFSDAGIAETDASPSASAGPTGTAASATGGASASGAAAEAGYGPKAHITITIDLKDLTDAGPHALGTLIHGESLSAGAIRRLACEAQIIPIVLGANSEPLDVGMAQRFVNRAMRRALNARDKGCVVCGAPPIFCDAHHLISWIDHGPTALTNLVLLCRRHHIDTHQGHWTITLDRGVVTVQRPAWAEPDPTRHRTRYRTFTPTHSTATAPPSHARHGTHEPVHSTIASSATLDDATPPFDPWADPGPPDPRPGKHTNPPDDPTPGHRALDHAENPPRPTAHGRAWDGASPPQTTALGRVRNRADNPARATTPCLPGNPTDDPTQTPAREADANADADADARLDPWADLDAPTSEPIQTTAETVDVRSNP